jgi:hypothetical protein
MRGAEGVAADKRPDPLMHWERASDLR